VLLGAGLFFMQIMQIPNSSNSILNTMRFRTSGDYGGGISKIHVIITQFKNFYSFGLFLMGLLAVCIFALIAKNKSFLKKYNPLLNIMTIIYIPPVFQVLVLQNHSAIHEFSMLKFALPVMFLTVILTVIMLELEKMSDANIIFHIENYNDLRNVKVPLFYPFIILFSVLFISTLNVNKIYFFQLRLSVGGQVSYEREYLIRQHYDFHDVYFSFTESIEANPPMSLAISKKLIYKIDSFPEIFEKFPNLKPEARLLLMVRKGTIENEQDILNTGRLLFSSQNFNVYELNRGIPVRYTQVHAQ
jgi:hypothetical protein